MTMQCINNGKPVPFADDVNGILVRTALTHPQIVVPHELRARVLRAAHYHKLSAHPGGRKLYQKLRMHFYWPSMAVDAYGVVRNCVTCARNRIKLRKYASALKLFPARAPLEQVAIDLLGELIQTPRGNRFLLVITDRYTKLTKVVPLKRITSETVSQAFVQHWVLNYGSPSYVLSDNGPQFTGRFFRETCRLLGTNNMYTTTYHPRANGQVERYNSTVFRALRHYITDHPREWDTYADAVTYAYNCQPHTSTKLAPFSLVLSNPPGPTGLDFSAMPKRTAESPTQYHALWQDWLRSLLDTADTSLADAQARYKRTFDQRVRPSRLSYRPGRYVFLRIDFRSAKDDTRHKLAPLVTGPHKIVSVRGQTLVLEHEDKTQERVSFDRVVPAPHPPTAEWTPKSATGAVSNGQVACPAPASLGLRHLAIVNDEAEPATTSVVPSYLSTPDTSVGETSNFDGVETIDVRPPRAEAAEEPLVIPLTSSRLTRGTVRPSPPAITAPAVAHASDEPVPEAPVQPESTDNTPVSDSAPDAPQPFSRSRTRRRYDPPSHIIDRILNHAVGDGTVDTCPAGETRYRVRWLNGSAATDTWHALRDLPRSALLRYYKRQRLPLPEDIDDARQG